MQSKEATRAYHRNWKKRNRSKVNLYYRHGYKKNPQKFIAKARRQNLRRNFGLSIEEYHQLFVRQNGVCAICRKSSERTRLAVDHDHNSTKVRGLLCSTCNLALGGFKDDPALLRLAALYLETNGTR